MMERRSIIPIKESARLAFNRMDVKFHSIRFCQAVREISGRAFLMDGTILRRLRELRDEDPAKYDYICIDNTEGLYKKVKKKEPVEV